ncbi:OB-fold protein [Mucilaginibacter psychrotolerans]|nr:hypothetical protein [Mucilaginibacter psychrotolerans]
MKSKISLIIFVLAFAAAIGVWYYAFKYSVTNHRDVANENAIIVSASQIVKDFQTNETKANKTYLNKVIQLKGEVLKKDQDQAGNYTLTLKSDDPFSSVFCTLKKGVKLSNKDSTITIKGVCEGFLSDVVLNDGVIVK